MFAGQTNEIYAFHNTQCANAVILNLKSSSSPIAFPQVQALEAFDPLITCTIIRTLHKHVNFLLKGQAFFSSHSPSQTGLSPPMSQGYFKTAGMCVVFKALKHKATYTFKKYHLFSFLLLEVETIHIFTQRQSCMTEVCAMKIPSLSVMLSPILFGLKYSSLFTQ